MGTHFVRLAVVILLAYACYAAFFFVIQRFIIYPGRLIRVAAASPSPHAGLEPVWLATPFGRVESWFLPGMGHIPGRRQPVVLFFHGNGEVIDFLPEEVSGFRALGAGVLLVEYPGYGRSEGVPSEVGVTAAALAAYDMVVRRDDVDPARVMAFGRSLGGGAACALSRRRPLAALILQSPFTSIRSFARRFLLPGFLVRDVYDNRESLAAFPGPVLILHGLYDDIIPVAHSRELARVARSARLVELSCAHNDCPPDHNEFWRIITVFLKAHGMV